MHTVLMFQEFKSSGTLFEYFVGCVFNNPPDVDQNEPPTCQYICIKYKKIKKSLE